MLSLTNMKPTGYKNHENPTSHRSRFRRLAVGVLLGTTLMLAGCGSSLPSMPSLGGILESKAAPKNITGTPEELYRIGDQRMSTGNYTVAVKYFEEVDRQHPYSPLARRAIVMASYAYYKGGKYPEAIAGAKRYVTLHPGTKEAALAQFIVSSSYFDRIKNPANDQTATRKALKELKVLVRRYPNSRYVPKVQNRIKIAYDVLAAQEMEVGRYYLKNSNYLASINRFKTVVRVYQKTKHVEEALARLTEAYMAMGIANEAQSAAAILGHNFPSSKWYHDSYALLKTGGLTPREHRGSWISRTWNTVTKAVTPG